ncbi:MAG: nucleotidyltransferase domain-containing protein [Candidatus Diapherotrites archaeon]|nr:nucleotidyltransferase domain-containing protein [Candidatus Diapherotrites archaeon]
MDDWQKTDFIKAEMVGPTKRVIINQKHPLYKSIRELFHKNNEYLENTIQIIQKNRILQSPRILAILVYGSFARKDTSGKSDIDLLIIAEKEDMELDEKFRKIIGEQIKMPISIAWMTPTEIAKRIKQKDKFVQNVLTEGRPLKGGEWIARTKRTL